MKFVYDDGGRVAAGFRGHAGDCVARSIAIAADLPYLDVYNRLAEGNATQRRSKHSTKGSRTARRGINVTRKWFREYMASIGFEWVPTMHIGSGCRVHLIDGELPAGRLVVAVSRHYTAVIDGVVRDTHDPQRATYWYDNPHHPDIWTRVSYRCVYGYWKKVTP